MSVVWDDDNFELAPLAPREDEDAFVAPTVIGDATADAADDRLEPPALLIDLAALSLTPDAARIAAAGSRRDSPFMNTWSARWSIAVAVASADRPPKTMISRLIQEVRQPRKARHARSGWPRWKTLAPRPAWRIVHAVSSSGSVLSGSA
jgi:hypothetical protein